MNQERKILCPKSIKNWQSSIIRKSVPVLEITSIKSGRESWNKVLL
jgi:hypothetical protein